MKVEHLDGGMAVVKFPPEDFAQVIALADIEPWDPRVGDRVKMIKEVDGLKANCGATVVHNGGGSDQDIVIEFDKKQLRGHFASGRTKDGFGWWVGVNDIEPLDVAAEAQPAAEAEPLKLKIEAGKFYKTRDGRKIGPMERYYDAWHTSFEDGRMWRDDGLRWFETSRGDTDLVAEWVEPASDENAHVAKQPVEKPKFKVGDRVRVVKHRNLDGHAISMDAPLGTSASSASTRRSIR
ncbi:hypothetical protein DOU54_06465 [Agrobacterium sp. MS2]|nr:hypothetical protein DOU54_06465 [Agrobacterium sp. MS2]